MALKQMIFRAISCGGLVMKFNPTVFENHLWATKIRPRTVAKWTDLSETTISNVIRMGRASLATQDKIAEALGVSREALFPSEGEK
jgi:hypothetical protein